MYQNWLLFSGQLLTLTFPMVGNYGVPDPSRRDEIGLEKGFESYKIHASALVVQDYAREYSHWDAHLSLGDWLKQEVGPTLFCSEPAMSASTESSNPFACTFRGSRG